MSVYIAPLYPTSNANSITGAGTYATQRNLTTATTTPGTVTGFIGQRDEGGPDNIGQYFLTFDTSSIPSGQTTAILSLAISTAPSASAVDTFEVRSVSSSANMIAGDSLAALSLLGSAAVPIVTGRLNISLNISSLPRASGTILLIHSQEQRLATAPGGPDAPIFHSLTAATANRPYLDLNVPPPWTFVGTSATVETATTTLTLTEPAGVADGDLLVATISSRSTATTAPTATGWTAVNSQNNNNTLTTGSAIGSGAMLYRVRSGAPTLAFTLPAGISVAQGRITAYRGSVQTTPLDVSTAVTAAAGTAVSVTGLTTTQDDDLIVAMTAGGQEATWASFTNVTTPLTASGAVDTTTAPSATAWIKRAETVTTTGADTSLGVFDAVRTGTGATGNLTVTASISAGHVVIAGAFKMLPPPTADAWNINDKGANITLSASDKTATSSGSGDGVRSTTTRTNGTAGKYYAEFLTGAILPTTAGISPTSNSLTTTPLTSRVVIASGLIILNAVNTGVSIGAFASSDVLCVAWDAGAETIWFRKNGGNWNNDASANPATGINGRDVSFAAATSHALWMLHSTTSAASATLRTELAEFTQAIPSGFTSWMGETPAAGGISVPVTGVEATGSVGTVTVATVASISVPVTGVQATGAVDQVTAIGRTPIGVPVTGVSATGAVDAVTIVGKANVSTTGVAAAGAVGSVTATAAQAISVPVTGIAATGAVGTVTVSTVTRVDVAAPVTGVTATGSVGSVTVTGKANTSITGVQATGAVGTVTAAAGVGVSVPVTGVQATGAAGTATVAGKANTTVTGVAATGSVGTVTVTAGTGVTVPVTGIAAAGSVDAVTIVGKANVALTGVASAGAIGGVSVAAGGSVSIVLAGVQATGSVGSVTVAAVQHTTVPVTGVAAVASVGSVTVTAAELAGLVSVWNGTAWVDKPMMVWTGSAWAQKPVLHWDGSAWV